MYPSSFEYFGYGDDAKILAGGQSLLPMMKLRIASPRFLIDVNRISALTGIRDAGDGLVIGAMCRHAEIADSPVVRQRLPLMIDAAHQTADVQVRNRGTIGGSLAHADPAGDWPAALLALDASVTITGPRGARTLPLRDFVVDAYTTQLAADEMLTGIAVPFPPARSGGAYVKFGKRAGDFAVASVGVQVEVTSERRCARAAISLGALGPTPLRARRAEAALQGQLPSGGVLGEAQRLVQDAADPFADTRGSVEYKRHLAGVLFRRAFDAALARAGR
jgi:carbon-monoxide dehydrogenase medium subunit